MNYWAERYLASEPELQRLIPFTSEDIDFRGNREDVLRIANQLKQTPVYPPKVAMTALAGAIPFHIGKFKSNIEVVRVIPGVSPKAIDSLAIQAEWSGRQIRVLDPISLLVGKAELAMTIPQAKRRDEEHLRILIPCVRGFLREFLAEVEQVNVPAKGWLGAVTKIIELSTSTRGRKAGRKLGIDWRSILPLPEITQSSHAKIVQFREKQLPRWMPG